MSLGWKSCELGRSLGDALSIMIYMIRAAKLGYPFYSTYNRCLPVDVVPLLRKDNCVPCSISACSTQSALDRV